MRDETRKNMQQQLIEDCHRASCIDPRIPLAMPVPFPRPEFGPSPAEWFARKHARGERGRFFPLHEAQYRRRDESWRDAG